MEITTKKKVAREVLIVFGLIFIGLVIYLFLISKNYFINSSISKLQSEIGDINANVQKARPVLEPEELRQLIEESNEKLTQNRDSINNRRQYLFTEWKIIPLTKRVMLVLILILYPGRIMIVAIRWSIRTLKTGD